VDVEGVRFPVALAAVDVVRADFAEGDEQINLRLGECALRKA
jgi:hypothetical protein